MENNRENQTKLLKKSKVHDKVKKIKFKDNKVSITKIFHHPFASEKRIFEGQILKNINHHKEFNSTLLCFYLQCKRAGASENR